MFNATELILCCRVLDFKTYLILIDFYNYDISAINYVDDFELVLFYYYFGLVKCPKDEKTKSHESPTKKTPP